MCMEKELKLDMGWREAERLGLQNHAVSKVATLVLAAAYCSRLPWSVSEPKDYHAA